jgi:hypothetical protein
VRDERRRRRRAAHVLATGLPADTGFTVAFLVRAAGAIVAALSVLLIPARSSGQADVPHPWPAPGAA